MEKQKAFQTALNILRNQFYDRFKYPEELIHIELGLLKALNQHEEIYNLCQRHLNNKYAKFRCLISL